MYEARRVADAPIDAPRVHGDAATAAAFRSAPRRAAVSPAASFVARFAPATLSVALVATTIGIIAGSRIEASPASAPEADVVPTRADQLSRGAARAIEPTSAEPTSAEAAPQASEAPVVVAWAAEFSPVVATWYAQGEVQVRAGASEETAALATLKGGDKVEVTERVVGEFRQVVVDKKVGWVPTVQLGEKAPVPGGVALSPGKTSSTRVLGLTPQAMGVYNAVMARWGAEINTVGGWRSSSRSDHQFGRAIDFMLTPGVESALGWTIAKYLAANAGELGVDHIIFEQKIWTPGNPTWRPMADRGSITQNHFDHVHVSVER